MFYVAFKWVQEHWPHHVATGEHICDVPVVLLLDGREVSSATADKYVAKIRVYNTAAHLVISEWGLSGVDNLIWDGLCRVMWELALSC